MAAAVETAPGKRKRLAVITTGDFDQKRLTYRHGGRDQWGRAYSVLWAGGGIRPGQVIGATNRHAAEVKDSPARPDDIAATLYELLGIPHDLLLKDATDRPHRISDGSPIRPLMT